MAYGNSLLDTVFGNSSNIPQYYYGTLLDGSKGWSGDTSAFSPGGIVGTYGGMGNFGNIGNNVDSLAGLMQLDTNFKDEGLLGDMKLLGQGLMPFLQAYNMFNQFGHQRDMMNLYKKQLGWVEEDRAVAKQERERIAKVRDNLNAHYA